MCRSIATLRMLLAAISCAVLTTSSHGERPWRQPQAEVDARGDLRWAPHEFSFQPGRSVRYVDFERGRDTQDGQSPSTAWKHHPWDPAASKNAARAKGVTTYIFRSGVTYRGHLIADAEGQPSEPIRLTRDPGWGTGPAVLCGADVVRGWHRAEASSPIPQSDKVWSAELDYLPRKVWMVRGDQVTELSLARTPNWTVTDPTDIKSQWWTFDNPDKPWGDTEVFNGIKSHRARDTVHLTGTADDYVGAYIWPEYGWVMSTPYPTRVLKFDPESRALVFGGQWSDQAGSYHIPRHARYYLEDRPQYLDSPGEFWVRRNGTGGTLFVRLPDDQDPRQVQVEAARWPNLIDSRQLRHVHISGLSFRFTNVYWDLDAPPTRDPDVDPACVRLLGSGRDIKVVGCRFEYVNLPVRMKAVGKDAELDQVVVADNDIRYTDHGAIWLADGGEWGQEYPQGRLRDVRVLRNRLQFIGRRPTRFGQGHAIEVDCAETAEIAGNIGQQLYASGIFVYGAKRSAAKVDRPLSRILIHHNKMVDTLLNSNDWGGIETWQGGPAYVFDNVSGNPRGYKNWGYQLQPDRPATSTFGHAYYMDGGFKQYYFNNIAWGRSRDPLGPLGNCSAFQEIHGFWASVFNNTAYNFVIGSRRQAPEAGRNKYLGNIWQGIGQMVFRHAQPSGAMADPNAADAGAAQSIYDLATDAYARNRFYDVPENIGVFEPDGRAHPTAASFRRAMQQHRVLGDLGQVATRSLLRDPAHGDFRPTSAARNGGVRMFVPWSVYAPVAEWHFYHRGDDPQRIPDEHLYLSPQYVRREDYKLQPTFPLTVHHVTDASYVPGPLEDWVRGALKLDGHDQYASVPNPAMRKTQAQEKVVIKNKKYDWITFEADPQAPAGRPLEVQIRLQGKGIQAGMKLRADLHWAHRNGRFGGMNAFGGEGQPVRGPGPYRFRFLPQEKPDLGAWIVTAWLTPTGEWTDHGEIARWQIAADIESPTQSVPSPAVDRSSFLLEIYFQAAAGHQDRVLIEKRLAQRGYSLALNQAGQLQCSVRAGPATYSLQGRERIDDGRWHHVLVEADRRDRKLRAYIDGQVVVVADGPGPDDSLENTADLFVGGTPEGRCLAGKIEFARIALGTLSDARTSIGELYDWQFDGPFLRDFAGRRVTAGRRDAGALQGVPEVNEQGVKSTTQTQ